MEFSDYQNAVLVVDDEQFILDTTGFVLERLGFQHILTAANAQQALASLAAAKPPVGLILSDLNMPDVDGIELLRRFDEQGYEGDIILFSGEDSQTLSMAENLARARRLSVLGSIAKPLQAESLSAMLAKHTENPRPRQGGGGQQVTAEMLDAAIAAGELEPWFQPKIDVVGREPVGVEALARWPNSAQGPIFPDAFIPVAEEHGLIDRLTFLLIEKAALFERQWQQQGVDLKIAVNISMDSLHDLEFPNRLDQVVRDAGSDLSRMQLEVTESRLMENLVKPLETLLRLRLKKVSLSIDDFGTGHSNLTQLRDLPFDELKLDRSYVHSGTEDSRSQTILESSVEIAKKLGMTIVAEGVEDLDDWNRVERLGCDQVQGYFIARPMPGDEIPGWIASWHGLRERLFG